MQKTGYQNMKHEANLAASEVLRVLKIAVSKTEEVALEIATIEEHDPKTIPGAINDQARVVRYQLEIISQKLDALEATAKVAVKS